jgi:predicted RNA methylase
MLSVAAAFVCDVVIAVDCDTDALAVARENAEEVELDDTIHFVQAQVLTKNKAVQPPQKGGHYNPGKSGGGRHNNNNNNNNNNKRGGGGRGGRGSQSSQETKAILIMDDKDGIPLSNNCVDTVLTNPPFGTKRNAGIDVQFLRTATRLARRSVYSFHKRSTRTFLMKTIQEWGYEVQVAAEMEFDIPQMYQFHNQKTKDIEVDLLRIVISKDDASPDVDTAQECLNNEDFVEP